MVDQTNPTSVMHRLLAREHLARVIQVAAELGLADRLGHTPVDVPSLAEATATHAASLSRLLRALAAIAIVQETDDRRYTLTSLGRTLRSDVPGSMRAWARLRAHETVEQPWRVLSDVVRTGEAAFPRIFRMDEWTYRAQEFSALFDQAMQSMTQGVNSGLIAHYPCGALPWLIDVGGGNGVLLIAILEQNAEIRGTVFELPHVAGHAREQIAAAGLSARSDVIEENALTGVPPGADGYLLKSVLHGRGDDEAVTVLGNCRSAMPAHGRVIVIERLLPDCIDSENEHDIGELSSRP